MQNKSNHSAIIKRNDKERGLCQEHVLYYSELKIVFILGYVNSELGFNFNEHTECEIATTERTTGVHYLLRY